MRNLSEIFNDEAALNGQGNPNRLLSSDGGTNVKDATADRRLQILNECGRLGKVLKKSDGSQYSSDELFAMPLADLQSLFDKTPADPARASQANDADMANVLKGVGDGTKPIVSMSAIFTRDNSLTLLSARRASPQADSSDAARIALISEFARGGKIPLRSDGFTPFSQDDWLTTPLGTLKVLLLNTRPVVRTLSA